MQNNAGKCFLKKQQQHTNTGFESTIDCHHLSEHTKSVSFSVLTEISC